MLSTQSRAATKCISEVPGLAKQTSTPPATRVRTRLSAPFIILLPLAKFLEELNEDQSSPARFVKGFAMHCSHRQGRRGTLFLNRAARKLLRLTRWLLAKTR